MQSNRLEINTKENTEDKIDISKDLVAAYSLDSWAEGFSLMTAGYRNQLDPDDAASPNVPINLVTIAILGEAKARVFKRKAIEGQILHVHIGGETRPHTQEFIQMLARVYAAHGFVVHLRSEINTTPIWYSSFGVFYEEFQSGDNLTASHSQYFKGGWKPMDSLGKQLVEEEDAIIKEVQRIVENGTTIQLAPWSSENILHDFDIDEAYVRYQNTVVDPKSIQEIKKAGEKGFRCDICTVGGSMKLTTERLFKRFGISVGDNGIIKYFFGEEDSQFHKIGQIDGDNFGVDPTKSQIYTNIGAQEKLLNNEANIVFLWDPDGDRFNMVTTAPAANIENYRQLGLEVEQGEDKSCIVYFTPNQIYLLLVAFRIDALKEADLFNKYDWFIASSVTTSRALDELAGLEGIPTVHVKVGFKWWGTFAEWLENREDVNEPYMTALGETTKLGEDPRLIIMCEESGGAVFGGSELLFNKTGFQGLVGMREKDGFQLGFLALSLAAWLYNKDNSFADYYRELIENKNIQNKYFYRDDKTLYDESLSGTKLQQAKKDGEDRRDKVMVFFHGLAKKYPAQMSLDQIQDDLNNRLAAGDVALPPLKNIRWIEDENKKDAEQFNMLEGAFLQFDNFWFVIRASGTDAVLRYYINGLDEEEVKACQKSLMNLQI
jgi:phosphomannomutase